MKRKVLTKTFMIISNSKTLWFPWFIQNISALKGLGQLSSWYWQRCLIKPHRIYEPHHNVLHRLKLELLTQFHAANDEKQGHGMF